MPPVPTRRHLLTTLALSAAALALYPLTRVAARVIDIDDSSVPRNADQRMMSRPAVQSGPEFSDVWSFEPWDVLLFLAGKQPRYPNANLDSLIGFAPADILESCDTDVLDNVQARLGDRGVGTLYAVIAAEILESFLDLYGGAPVVLALDAGHGGKRGVYFDPGSQGTEWLHARRVVETIETQIADPRYTSITLRRIFNDDIGDDFLLPPPNDRKSAASLTMRAARAAILAYEAAVWNAAHPDAAVAVHVLSVHFNAGSGGSLVLHQGEAVPEEFRLRSVEFGGDYVQRVRNALNNTGILPYGLRLALGTGLSDDHVLYAPMGNGPSSPINPYTGVDRRIFPRRYAMLLASLLERDYVDGALRYHKLK